MIILSKFITLHQSGRYIHFHHLVLETVKQRTVLPPIFVSQDGRWNGMISAAGISYFTHICTECALYWDLQSENWFLGNIENNKKKNKVSRNKCYLILFHRPHCSEMFLLKPITQIYKPYRKYLWRSLLNDGNIIPERCQQPICWNLTHLVIISAVLLVIDNWYTYYVYV